MKIFSEITRSSSISDPRFTCARACLCARGPAALWVSLLSVWACSRLRACVCVRKWGRVRAPVRAFAVAAHLEGAYEPLDGGVGHAELSRPRQVVEVPKQGCRTQQAGT